MRAGRQMDDVLEIAQLLAEHVADGGAQVVVDEAHFRVAHGADLSQPVEVTRAVQPVEQRQLEDPQVEQVLDQMGADEAGAARDQDAISHP